MRNAFLVIVTLVNVGCFVPIAFSFFMRGAKLPTPWDGPTLATVALTAATVVLTSVALGVALLTIWGYTTLREHAANTAKKAAGEMAESVATKTVQTWLAGPGREIVLGAQAGAIAEGSVADAYKEDGQ